MNKVTQRLEEYRKLNCESLHTREAQLISDAAKALDSVRAQLPLLRALYLAVGRTQLLCAPCAW